MQMKQFNELRDRATADLIKQRAADRDQARTAKQIKAELAAMRREGKILTLTKQEECILAHVRAFKARWPKRPSLREVPLCPSMEK